MIQPLVAIEAAVPVAVVVAVEPVLLLNNFHKLTRKAKVSQSNAVCSHKINPSQANWD